MTREVSLTDPNPPRLQRKNPEQVLLLYTEGTADHWGDFEVFRGTTWEAGIRVVSAESLSNALHGLLLPLLRELGRDPRASAKRVSEAEGACALRGGCLAWDAALCRPGGQTSKELGPPGCYEPPLDDATSPEVADMFRRVTAAWKEGRHTLVVVGSGFNLR